MYAPGENIDTASKASDTATVVSSGPDGAAGYVAGAAALVLEQLKTSGALGTVTAPGQIPERVWQVIDAETTKRAIRDDDPFSTGKLLHITDRPWAVSDLTAEVAPAVGVGSGQVRLSWTLPADPGLSPTDYVIERSTDGSTWTVVDDGVSTAKTATVMSLTNGTAYSFPRRRQELRRHRPMVDDRGHTPVVSRRSAHRTHGRDGAGDRPGCRPGEADVDRAG